MNQFGTRLALVVATLSLPVAGFAVESFPQTGATTMTAAYTQGGRRVAHITAEIRDHARRLELATGGHRLASDLAQVARSAERLHEQALLGEISREHEGWQQLKAAFFQLDDSYGDELEQLFPNEYMPLEREIRRLAQFLEF